MSRGISYLIVFGVSLSARLATGQPDGRRLVVYDVGGGVQAWDVADQKRICSTPWSAHNSRRSFKQSAASKFSNASARPTRAPG